jgi:hypothetical protein
MLRMSRSSSPHKRLHGLPLDPSFAGSNPAQDDGFLMAIKIRSTTFFGGEVKPFVPCRKTLRHLKIHAKYDRDTSSTKFEAVSEQDPASLLSVSAATRELWWINQE